MHNNPIPFLPPSGGITGAGVIEGLELRYHYQGKPPVTRAVRHQQSWVIAYSLLDR